MWALQGLAWRFFVLILLTGKLLDSIGGILNTRVEDTEDILIKNLITLSNYKVII